MTSFLLIIFTIVIICDTILIRNFEFVLGCLTIENIKITQPQSVVHDATINILLFFAILQAEVLFSLNDQFTDWLRMS